MAICPPRNLRGVDRQLLEGQILWQCGGSCVCGPCFGQRLLYKPHFCWLLLCRNSCLRLLNVHSTGLSQWVANTRSLTNWLSCCCRWNTLAAPDVGLTLQLLPMLLGFFTYKVAVITKTGLSLLETMSKGPESTPEKAAAEGSNSGLGASYSQQILTK